MVLRRMSDVANELRGKARRCRELARGLDEETRLGLLSLADAYDAEADAHEAAPDPAPEAKPRNEPNPGK
jgi:hypothetical protein